ncbi:WD40 repeat-like protein [Schizopora paradoxa]|uniref:WD40 repeat-like protein n=1 Tax=Schizopora paradoxa TaxID=27342 RepID=A0A0H2RSU0_9AGAM|nr:WD40 repeat-like protein [Schizopora paradoxa]
MRRKDADVDIVDGSFAAVPASQVVTRPPSPTPTADYSIVSPPSPMSFVHVIPPVHVPNGIYDVFTSPTSGPAGTPNCTLFISPKQGSTSMKRTPSKVGKAAQRLWDALSSPVGKRRRTRFGNCSHVYDGLPLDGEEGELVDEACVIAIRPDTGIDILGNLPPEVALLVFSFLDMPSVLACRTVCKYWSALSYDSIIWRELFYDRGWRVDEKRVSASTNSNSAKRTIFMHRPPLSLDWQHLYVSRLKLERCWNKGEPKATTIAGHEDSVYCLEFDSKKIVTGSRDRSIKIWDIASGKMRAKLVGHNGSVLCLKFDKVQFPTVGAEDDDDDLLGNGFLISGSSDCNVFVWDLRRLKKAPKDEKTHGPKQLVKRVLKGHSNGVLDLKTDKNWIVSCSKDALIRVWDRKTFSLFTTLHGHEGPVNAIGLQDGKVVSASGDGTMMLWDIATGNHIRTFDGHNRGLACIEFKDDTIISGSNDCKIKIWNAKTGECIKTLSGHKSLVRALTFDPASRRLVSASYDRSVKVWDMDSGKVLREFKGHTSHVLDVKFDVSRIVSASHDRKIIVLDFGYELDTSLFI